MRQGGGGFLAWCGGGGGGYWIRVVGFRACGCMIDTLLTYSLFLKKNSVHYADITQRAGQLQLRVVKRLNSQLCDNLPLQIIDNHIPPNPYPPPPKPPHLTLMCLHHCILSSPPLAKVTHKQQTRRLLSPLSLRHPRRSPPPYHHRHRCIEGADVLSQDIGSCQRVKFDRTLPARFPHHERG